MHEHPQAKPSFARLAYDRDQTRAPVLDAELLRHEGLELLEPTLREPRRQHRDREPADGHEALKLAQARLAELSVPGLNSDPHAALLEQADQRGHPPGAIAIVGRMDHEHVVGKAARRRRVERGPSALR